MDGSTVLLMQPGCEVPIKGSTTVKCLRGKIAILGYELQTGQEYSVCCSNSASLLTLVSLEENVAEDDSETGDLLTSIELDLKSLLSNYPVVIHLSALCCHTLDFICLLNSFQDLFSDLVVGPEDGNQIIIPEALESAVSSILHDVANGMFHSRLLTRFCL